jgi:hydroxyquinol 1,2-dioxygenase
VTARRDLADAALTGAVLDSFAGARDARAEGFQTLITHVFVAGDEHLDSDAVFGVRDNLIGTFERHEPGTAPDGSERDSPYWTMSFDMVLAR